jgi:IMP dehydrogenase
MSYLSEKLVGEGLTYDDVLLVPSYSEVLPREVNIKSKFSRNIILNTPVVSAAMDTVTESEMAIAMAREGGIGVIHKNMSIDAQAALVRKVKRSESGMIQDPVTLQKGANVGDALKLMAENKIGGIPVVEESGKLCGIVTNRDLRFEKDFSKPIVKVMTETGLITTDKPNDMASAEDILQEHKIEKLPVVNKEGMLIGLITYKDIIKLKKYPNSCKDSFGRLRVAAAVGVTHDTMLRVEALVKAGVDAVVIDTAHGHSKGVLEMLKNVKATFGSKVDVVVGNIATPEAANMLADAGADGIKVGIGQGLFAQHVSSLV